MGTCSVAVEVVVIEQISPLAARTSVKEALLSCQIPSSTLGATRFARPRIASKVAALISSGQRSWGTLMASRSANLAFVPQDQ